MFGLGRIRDLHISKNMAEIIRADLLEKELKTNLSAEDRQEIQETIEQLDNLISSFPE